MNLYENIYYTSDPNLTIRTKPSMHKAIIPYMYSKTYIIVREQKGTTNNNLVNSLFYH